MWFWKKNNKNKDYPKRAIVISLDEKLENNLGYVDIFELTQKLYCLNQLVSRIEEIAITENDLGLMNYQLSLRAAYIAEFEHSYQETGCKPISYNDYKRTRSTL